MRIRKKPDKRLLKEYFKLWLEGLAVDQIATRLEVTEKYLQKYQSQFLTYCQHQAQFEIKGRLTNKKPVNFIKLTEERRKQFLDYYSKGMDYSKISNLMKVPLITITDVWLNDEDFACEVDAARNKRDLDVITAMYKSCLGYDLDTLSITEREIKLKGKKGKNEVIEIPAIERVVTRSVKHFVPNVQAQRTWLINRQGWSDTKIEGEITTKRQVFEIGDQTIEF